MLENLKEKIAETKICRFCSTSFDITDKDQEFYDKISPVFNGIKYNIPSPTLCPDCRQQRRLSFRNERNLYKGTCDATGKEIISVFSPDKPYKVFNIKDWWGDKWDPKDYCPADGIDFGRSFFEQFEEFSLTVPRNPTFVNISTSINSDYTNHSSDLKDCYFAFATWACENCLYVNLTTNARYCVDCTSCINCEYCYGCVDTKDSFDCFYCVGSDSNSFTYFSYNCEGCSNCFACSNLKNQKYCIENKQYNEFEYKEKVKEYFQKFDQGETILEKVRKNTVFPNLKIIGSEDCLGNNIISSKNCTYCFDAFDVQNSKYLSNGLQSTDIYDAYGFGGGQCSLGYEIVDVGLSSSNQYFSLVVHNTSNVFYSQICYNSSNLFGCIGLRNSQYCILNKQYTKEEYEQIVPKIIEHMQKTGEWGEFFPSSISPFGYNETVAMEYYPLSPPSFTKEGRPKVGVIPPEGRQAGVTSKFKWSSYETPIPKVEKIIPSSLLPKDISEVPDDILNWAIECEITGKPFRIIKPELDFYRKHSIPIPKKHPDVRHAERMKLRDPQKLYNRVCDKCHKDIKSVHSKDGGEIVYCEECYLKEVA